MAEAAAFTIEIPPELFASLQRYAADRDIPLREVAEEALRNFVDDEELTDIRRYHVLRAESLNVSLDDYVMQMVKEHQRERREQQAA